MNKFLIFDYDKTIAQPESEPIPEIIEIFRELLKNNYIAVLTGGRSYEQLYKWIVKPLSEPQNLIIATEYGNKISYDHKKYTNISLSKTQKLTLLDTWKQLPKKEYGLESISGPQIVDKETIFSIECLGENADSRIKSLWDKDFRKRKEISKFILDRIPFPINIYLTGRNSIDIVGIGHNKADNIIRLTKLTEMTLTQTHYFGDEFSPIGNDYPITQLDIEIHKVDSPNDTLNILKDIYKK